MGTLRFRYRDKQFNNLCANNHFLSIMRNTQIHCGQYAGGFNSKGGSKYSFHCTFVCCSEVATQSPHDTIWRKFSLIRRKNKIAVSSTTSRDSTSANRCWTLHFPKNILKPRFLKLPNNNCTFKGTSLYRYSFVLDWVLFVTKLVTGLQEWSWTLSLS